MESGGVLRQANFLLFLMIWEGGWGVGQMAVAGGFSAL